MFFSYVEVPTDHEWIHIGLWEGCFKENDDDDWLCNSYGDDDNPKSDSPNSGV